MTIVVDKTEISVISREDLIKNKRSTGRIQDMADAETLEKWKKMEKMKTINVRGRKSRDESSKKHRQHKSMADL
jgi:hypothetical protein